MKIITWKIVILWNLMKILQINASKNKTYMVELFLCDK